MSTETPTKNSTSPSPRGDSSHPATNEGDALLQDVRESLHDIRNHLNAVLGLISMMLLQSRDEAASRFRPLVEEQSAQLRYLIDRLGQPGLVGRASVASLSTVDPARWVPALADLYTPFAAEHGMRLQVRVDAGTLRFKTDARALHRLLSNLLVNAIKHSQASLVVLRAAPLDATQPGAGVQFIVVDDGVGLDEQVQQSLNRVLSGQRDLSPQYDRAGFGIVARLARDLGAGVVLESEPDDGTTVTVIVPSVVGPSPALGGLSVD